MWYKIERDVNVAKVYLVKGTRPIGATALPDNETRANLLASGNSNKIPS